MRKGAILLAVVGTIVVNALWPSPEHRHDATNDTATHSPGNVDSTFVDENEIATPESSSVVEWADTWSEAATRARREGKLVFVYVALEPEACPPCARLEGEVFSRPEAARLAEDAVPLRLLATGALDAESQALVDRVMLVCPSLFVVTPDGDLLARLESGLYDVYRRDFDMLADAPEGLADIEQFVVLIASARERERRERPRIEALARRGDPDARYELASLFRGRQRFERAEHLLRASLATREDVATRALLAEVLLDAGRGEDAHVVLRALIERYPDHPLFLAWRVDSVLLELARHVEPGPELRSAEGVAAFALSEIAELAAHAMHFGIEARARMEVGRLHERMERRAPLARVLRWFDANGCGGVGAPVIAASVRWEVAQLCRRAGQPELALRQLECIQREHPESTEAQRLKHGLLDIVRFEIENSG